MTRVNISSLASEDLRIAASYYAEVDQKLASAFLQEFDRISSVVSELPEIGSPVGDGYRKMVMRRFPFTVIYRNELERILILAVGHQRRHPDSWLKRK